MELQLRQSPKLRSREARTVSLSTIASRSNSVNRSRSARVYDHLSDCDVPFSLLSSTGIDFRRRKFSFEQCISPARVSRHSRDQLRDTAWAWFLSTNALPPDATKLSSPASHTPSSNESSSVSKTAIIGESCNSSRPSENRVA